MRLIDADVLREEWAESGSNEYIYDTNAFLDSIDEQPTVDVFPLKIGDEAWVIRSFRGTKHAKKGIVTAMCYTQKMELCITVGKLAVGKIGEKVFLTKEDAEMAMMRGE